MGSPYQQQTLNQLQQVVYNGDADQVKPLANSMSSESFGLRVVTKPNEEAAVSKHQSKFTVHEVPSPDVKK